MCVGIPMQVLAVDGLRAQATDGTVRSELDLSLVGSLPVGTWVLSFLGAAREVISAEEAAKISAAVDALRSVMAGGEAGDAFADIEERGPQLPPHLQAALAAGKTTG